MAIVRSVVFLSLICGALLSEQNEYDCIIKHLKSNNMLKSYDATAHHNATDCDEVLELFNTQIVQTYNNIFDIHPTTEPKVECIMKNFNKSKASDYVLEKFSYEYLRSTKQIEKSIFCEAMKETDGIIENEMKKSVVPCVPDFEMQSLFEADSAVEECRRN